MDDMTPSGFVKIYGSRLLNSSLIETSLPTRWAFMVMLAGADENGFFRCATVGGLARTANISTKEAETAIAELEAPDPHSTSAEDDGRRIRPVRGGWIMINFLKYREFRSARQVAAAERQKEWRQKKRNTRRNTRNALCVSRTKGEGEGEGEREKRGNAPGSDEPKAPSLPRHRDTDFGDLVWFALDDTIVVSPRAVETLERRFPAYAERLKRKGSSFEAELRQLSNWHSTAPKSKRKRLTAQRWLFGKLFPAEERKAQHAAKHRPGGGAPAAPKSFDALEKHAKRERGTA